MDTIKLAELYEEALESAHIRLCSKHAIKVAKEITKLFPLIKQVQPHITSINTGMGTWSYNGHGIAFSNEEENKGEQIIIEDVSLGDIIMNGASDWYDFPLNDALIKITQLLDFLVNTNGLNCSTWQDGFNENGVIFIHSEASNQNNPFAIPNKEYHIDTDYYRGLVKSKVPIVFIDKSNNL